MVDEIKNKIEELSEKLEKSFEKSFEKSPEEVIQTLHEFITYCEGITHNEKNPINKVT